MIEKKYENHSQVKWVPDRGVVFGVCEFDPTVATKSDSVMMVGMIQPQLLVLCFICGGWPVQEVTLYHAGPGCMVAWRGEEKPSMVRCHLVPLWFWRMVKECLPNESLLGVYIWSFFGSRRAKGRWYPSLQWFIEKDGDEKGKGEWERDGYREGKNRDKEMLKQSDMFICAYF